jgi:hypothetical protein
LGKLKKKEIAASMMGLLEPKGQKLLRAGLYNTTYRLELRLGVRFFFF